MVGYSGTPLAKKLGLKVGSSIVLAGAPGDYLSLIEPVPNGVTFAARVSEITDVVHVFCTRREELRSFLEGCRSKMKSSAMVWVSWPKKSSKVPSEVTEDVIRELALPMGFVDVKVCADTDVWSVFVRRRLLPYNLSEHMR